MADERSRYDRALEAIDAANGEDPNRITWQGQEHPKELLHARMMTDRVLQLDPDAGELQLLAARANHFRRWLRPRSDYPEGRAGYLRWRAAAKKFHADEVGAVLRDAGYSDVEIERVGAIIRKEGRATDPVVQTHEDALCLVFLETQLDALAGRIGEDEMVAVLAKTIPKLSPAGVAAALELPLGDWGSSMLGRAAAGE